MSLSAISLPPGGEAELSIGDLADRVGVSVATLRIWESRHGFPAPRRRASGHRRYDAHDLALVEDVVRRRGGGVRLDVAISQAIEDDAATTADRAAPAASVASAFARIRQLHPEITAQRLSKRTLLHLTRAVEDELGARPQRSHLFGSFQRARYFAAAENRWADLAQWSASTFAFADFADFAEGEQGAASSSAETESQVRRVPLPLAHPMRREWSIVCDGPELSVALTAWELPGQQGVRDRDRVFECLWTVDPAAVRAASRACADNALELGIDGAADVVHDLGGDPRPVGPDPDLLGALFTRSLAYVDASR